MRLAVTFGLGLALVWACGSESDDSGRFAAVSGGTGGTGGASVSAAAGGASNASSSNSASQSSQSSSSAASSSSSGAGCADANEPNDSESAAKVLPPETDCDGTSMIIGTLSGSDVDWFKYDGTDKLGCSVDPTRTLSSDGQVRLCKYASCPGAVVTCPQGTNAQKSPKGVDGCCAQQGFTIGVDCNGISDNATIYISLDKPKSPTCTSYTVTYHY